MNTRNASVVGLIAGLALVSGTANAQFWALDIGTGLTEDISDNGVASGSFGYLGGNYFMWTADGGSIDIGGVSPGNGVGGQGKISDDGRYISGSTYNAAEDWTEMSRYDTVTGTWTGFGAIPGHGAQIDAETTGGWSISGDGNTVVGLGWTNIGTADAHAIRWTQAEGIVDLGSNAVGRSSRANSVNYDGSVVAGWQDGAGRQGAVWVNGVQELIFQSDGVTAAQEAFAVSGNGQYATGLGLGRFFAPGNAYRYNIDTDTYEVLDNLTSGAGSRMAGADITDDGSIIVGGTWGTGPATFGTAFIWQEGVGTMSLSDYLDGLGIAYDDGFHFAFASGISSDGQWITGWGNYGSPATTTSFVVKIPSPATAAMLGLGGLMATRRRRT